MRAVIIGSECGMKMWAGGNVKHEWKPTGESNFAIYCVKFWLVYVNFWKQCFVLQWWMLIK